MAEPEILTQQQHEEDERDETAAKTAAKTSEAGAEMKDATDTQSSVSQEEKEDPEAFVNNGACH